MSDLAGAVYLVCMICVSYAWIYAFDLLPQKLEMWICKNKYFLFFLYMAVYIHKLQGGSQNDVCLRAPAGLNPAPPVTSVEVVSAMSDALEQKHICYTY